jgi:hypothetical protein
MRGRDHDAALAAEVDATIALLLPSLGRAPWFPVVEPDDGEFLGSRFGGRPWLAFGDPWPSCPCCGERMQFFVQLDLAALPDELGWPHRSGLIQLFYCTAGDPLCEVECEAWTPFARSVVGRWIPGDRLGSSPGRVRIPDNARYPNRNPDWVAVRIVRWERRAPELPVYADEAWDRAPVPFELRPALHDALRERQLHAGSGDKLGGWPSWVQGPEYATCPRCGDPMPVLLQIESNGHVGHQFGDMGAGHVSQCRRHPEVVAFGWACG